MAIQTRGFDVSVMPTYTPVNPSLAAFNPSQVLSGFGQGLDTLGNVEKLKLMQTVYPSLGPAQVAQNELAAKTAQAAIPNVAPGAALTRAQIDTGMGGEKLKQTQQD